MARLGDYVKIRTGKLDANASSENGNYPFFTCSIEPLKIETYSYDCECVLVAGNGDLNVKYYNGKFDAYQRTYIIESIDKKVLSVPYIYGFLDRYVEELRRQSIGGVIKYIKLGNLTEAQIPMCSIEEQNLIMGNIQKVNSLISLRKQQLSKLDELVKSRFIEMFGMLGSNEKGWELKPISEFAVINPKKSDDKRLLKGLEVSFVPMPMVGENGEFDSSVIKTFDEVKTGFTYFSEGDVLFAKITPCMENGKGAVATGLKNGIGFGSTEFHILRPIKNRCNAYWIYTLTTFQQFRKDAEKKMTGSAGQKRVPSSFLSAYMVALPPIELQNEFAAFVEQTDKTKLKIKQSLEKLETLKKSLMQKYFG